MDPTSPQQAQRELEEPVRATWRTDRPSPQQGDISPGGAEKDAITRLEDTLETLETGGTNLAASLLSAAERPQRTYRRIIFVTIPVFMAYACLFALQGALKTEMSVSCGAAVAERFGVAVSSLYIGNLIFRFAHNILLFPLTPRGRTCLSIVALMASMAVIGVGIFALKKHDVHLVYVAYGLGGVGVGSFESNLLSAITPLGPQTKLWATLGIPAGVVSITVGSFVLLALNVPPVAIYGAVFFFLLLALLLFVFGVPYHQIAGNGNSFAAFRNDLASWRQWLPQTKWYALALAIDMFAVSTFSPGVMLYIFPKGQLVPFFGGKVEKNVFFAVYNMFTFIGEVLSRKLAYADPELRQPYGFLIFSAIGVTINIVFSKVWWCPSLFPLAGFFIFFANGSIYNRACRHIDESVPKSFNLTALSFWLFLGDFGSVTGANIMQYLKVWMVGAGRGC